MATGCEYSKSKILTDEAEEVLDQLARRRGKEDR
jgi:hypothetical protein